MSEKFYHFTAKRFLQSIQRNGITRGVMVKSINPVEFIFNKQWITKNPNFDQSWAEGTGRLSYQRNEVRLTIEIPLEEMVNCKSWDQIKFLTPLVSDDLSAFGDPENWYIYSGRIKPEWICAIDFNSNQPNQNTTENLK